MKIHGRVDSISRDNFNKAFGTITTGKAQNGNYDLQYHTENHKSSILYGNEAEYKYGYHQNYGDDATQRYPIAGINEQYLIRANTLDATPDCLLGQAQYTIDDIYQQGIEEIPNINLGLREREMPDISLVQDVQSAQIGLNGYTYTYKYADRFDRLNKEIADFIKQHPGSDKYFNIGVNFSYTRTIYKSDLVFDQMEGKGQLQVYVSYEIRLANEASTVNTKVNQLYNYFDRNYENITLQEYEKDNQGNPINIKDINNAIKNRTSYGDGIDRILIEPDGGINIGHNAVKYLKLTYKLNDEAVLKVLNQDVTLDSTTEVVSYSSYSDENFTNSYAGIDADSAPNNMVLNNENTYEDDTSKAPSFILKSDPTRSLEGTVWQDNAIEKLLAGTGLDKQRLGNGLYDKEVENVVKDVQVELLKQNANGEFELTKLYQTTGEDKATRQAVVIEPENAIIQTDATGHYKFEGLTPGEYLIRFTYKNNSVLCTPDGTEVQTLEQAAEGGVEYYKSTTYRTARNNNGEIIRQYHPDEAANTKWYVLETGENYRLSDAKDNEAITTHRTTQDEINYATAVEESKINEISASTNQLTIPMDISKIDMSNISHHSNVLNFQYNNLDFGITRRPKQELEIAKSISYVEVVLTNGQIVIKGDPNDKDHPIEGLKVLPNGKIHIELDEEIIQGATLKVYYDISVDNKKCEIDYNDQNYYYYGTPNNKNENWKIAQVKEMFDYPNPGLSFDAEQEINEGWTIQKLEDLIAAGRLENTEENNLGEALKKYNIILTTHAFEGQQPGTIQTKQLLLTRLLSNKDDELDIENDIEVNQYTGRKQDHTTPGNYNPTLNSSGLPGENPTSEDDNATGSLVITGPTGEDKDYIPYILLGITSFMILGAGIVLIKKKLQ